MATGDIGLIGLAVMGQNLILNMNDKGFNVVAYNRTTSKVDHFLANEAKGTNIQGAHSIEELVSKLKTPRKIVLLVKAGSAVDDFIAQLEPHLEKGDIIIDGGNSHYPDSIRRTKELEAKGLLFVGSGVSGGEEGARYGPSLMPGGSTAAWPAIQEIFQKTAAQVNGEPCCDWVGETGSGHYVKMVHNGIEYGDMQLIAEAYDILKRGLGLPEDEIADIFLKWNTGVLDSFLIEITANILKFKDDDGEPVVSKILDKAGQKGTGKWTAIAALDAGTAVTLIGEAVFARCLSAIKEERVRASKIISGPQIAAFKGDKKQFIDDLEQALYASKIISYTQGFMLMRETAKELDWNLNYAGIAKMWRGGCIIKSVFLGDITSAYQKNPKLESLLFDDFFNKAVHNAQDGWRKVVAQAVLWGIPTPAFSTALAFFDGYRSEIVPANLLQAQRDYFGAHTFRVLPGKENAKFKTGEDIPEAPAIALEFYASELRLRGDDPVEQPHQRGGNVLCWNGEIFDGMDISARENDGSRLFDKLQTLQSEDDIRDLFGSIEGPYAFVYYQSYSQRVYFGRDPLGRRSLLIHRPTLGLPYILLASVSNGVDPRYDFEEVSTDSIFYLDLQAPKCNLQEDFASRLVHIPRHSAVDLKAANPRFAVPSKVNTSLPSTDDVSTMSYLSQVPEHLTKAVNDLIYHLDNSVRQQVQNIPHKSEMTGKARVGVLFSGGIDSTVIAYLAHRHIPFSEPIDLLNVAFENPRKIRIQAEGNNGRSTKKHKKKLTEAAEHKNHTSYNVPDRITGLQEVEELRRLCPQRTWNFVEVNVPYYESHGAREIVESLMLPGRTVMDLSLALALYFASRGVGQVRATPEAVAAPYTSSASVLLNGLGSDELLGGYGRHRTAYISGGWQAVIEELQLEIDRIPTRNLGRDDRVISTHGKETRHPFLSLTVLNFLASLPVHFKMDPRLETGLGDKMLLRLACWKLGLVEASQRKKRAMQFGSHSARMDGERRGDTLLE
ncbi:hypothetical protein H0H87_011000 [Tephrocybe sp. NHM501043]|nr:hypothetical protein H0H87_011000 [Tephrocybe sp. NHM501043]